MSSEIYHISTIRNGHMQNNVRQAIANELQRYEGKRVEISIKQLRGKRSLPQNSFLHFALTLLTNSLNELGNKFTMQEVKDMMKAKFLLEDVVNKETGECLGQKIKPTSSLNKLEMVDFIEAIIMWADELGIVIPRPNSQFEIF